MKEIISYKIPLAVAIIGITAVLVLAISALFLLAIGDGPTISQPVNTIITITIMPTAAVPARAVLSETAVSTTPIASITPSPAPPVTHTVRSGETLYGIAQLYGIKTDDIITTNQITNPNALDTGQTLNITASQEKPSNEDIPTSPTNINGIPITQFVNMDAATLQTVRTIFARGQEMGRNPNAFSKAGDSTIELPHFLSRFDSTPYNLAEFAYLQSTIDHYHGSFSRDSAAVQIGMHAWTMLDPAWANKTVCLPNETPISCEIRLHNPSIMLIRLGANDNAGAAYFDEHMRQIVEAIIAEGVIPILSTKSDRAEGSNINNDTIRQITADYHLPVWDFDQLADTLPNRGLDSDSVHMTTFYAHDYTDPTAFTRGHAMHNLTALLVLDIIRQHVITKE